jgi:hypothetical protein
LVAPGELGSLAVTRAVLHSGIDYASASLRFGETRHVTPPARRNPATRLSPAQNQSGKPLQSSLHNS